MEKQGNSTAGPWLRELVSAGLYKRSQGRIARQLTFAGLAVAVLLGCWRLSVMLGGEAPATRLGVPGAVLLAGLWLSYRVVNIPRFADFLIAVEAEMNKVSWPSRTELIRSSMVVIVTILLLSIVLGVFDSVWYLLFDLIGVK
jgi:preprotein translocase subunit SecE